MTPDQLRHDADEADRHPDPTQRVVIIRHGGGLTSIYTPTQARAAADLVDAR